MNTIQDMLEKLRDMGIDDERILAAMGIVRRERFVQQDWVREAYADHPLPIGHEQTISQPYTVAFMLELLELGDGLRVLEVGAGSGWNAALLGKLVGPSGSVVSTEIIPELAENARERVASSGVSNVKILQGDGSLGLQEEAPFDRIIVTAACPELPPPLSEQLADGGVIVAPVGGGIFGQYLMRARKRAGKLERENLGTFLFVPLRGEYGLAH